MIVGELLIKFNTFENLPDAKNSKGKVYLVLFTSGVILINKKKSGFYYSDGINWHRLG